MTNFDLIILGLGHKIRSQLMYAGKAQAKQ